MKNKRRKNIDWKEIIPVVVVAIVVLPIVLILLNSIVIYPAYWLGWLENPFQCILSNAALFYLLFLFALLKSWF